MVDGNTHAWKLRTEERTPILMGIGAMLLVLAGAFRADLPGFATTLAVLGVPVLILGAVKVKRSCPACAAIVPRRASSCKSCSAPF